MNTDVQIVLTSMMNHSNIVKSAENGEVENIATENARIVEKNLNLDTVFIDVQNVGKAKKIRLIT